MILKLQQVIYQLLNKESITKHVQGIYYKVPPNSRFPYIYIGDFYSKNRSTRDQEINEIYFKINLYIRDKSIEFINIIEKEIKKSLQSNQETIISYIEEKLILQNDGITQKLGLTFKALITEDKNVI